MTTDRINGGSPVVHPQQYRTLPTAVIDGAQQRDRYLNHSEAKELLAFMSTGLQRLKIAKVLAYHADKIVAAGGKRIFVGGNPMDYFEKPEAPLGLPGSGYYVAEDYLSAADTAAKKLGQSQDMKVDQAATSGFTSPVSWFKELFFSGKPSVPSSFRAINISKYGSVRMKRSMRDLGWFLRYITYAIIAGDTSIISVNTRGLRGVIPEDVTLATSVALREMQWKSLAYFPADSAAAALVKQYFDVLIADYWVEKPSDRPRPGVSKHHQGLALPESYEDSSRLKPRWVMKPGLSELEKEAVIKAAYRQVFERDIGQMYGGELSALVSQVKGQGKGGYGSMQSFIRGLGKSRLYRQLYYEPYTISRAIELACRHFLGRGLSCMEEFKGYFELISDKGFPALVDTFLDSQEYAEYFGEETVPFLRGLGVEAQECRNWGPQLDLFKYSAPVRKVPQFVTTFAGYQEPLPNQHPYGVGNDPLETQFGAIFPQENRHPQAQPAHFSKDSRRILISSGDRKGHTSSVQHDVKTHAGLGRVPGASDQRIFALPSNPVAKGKGLSSAANGQQGSVFLGLNSTQHSVDAVILAAYRQVFGREVLESQRQWTLETQLRGDLITVREFVRQLAKSRIFRRVAWENLYITKAIEYIHRRLLGRPTRDRNELNKYYNICSRQGFYALVDAMVDSDEYAQAFGDNLVPYERYVTPRGLAMRIPQGPVAKSKNRENPPIIEEYMMRYRPPTAVRHQDSLRSEYRDNKTMASANYRPNPTYPNGQPSSSPVETAKPKEVVSAQGEAKVPSEGPSETSSEAVVEEQLEVSSS
ncbi:MAG: phycobilisome rod-core linker polypeptide [Cyanobacteria bacterium J06555_13]